MSPAEELEAAIEEYHAAAAEFVRGRPERYKAIYSHRDDVCNANPFRPVAHGWAEVEETLDRAASFWQDGEIVGFERLATFATAELAYVLEFERFRAKIGGREEPAEIGLRVTSVLRPEEDGWKVVHRHADSITTPQPPESVLPD
jgi:ketosteroid isomerase-like protein